MLSIQLPAFVLILEAAIWSGSTQCAVSSAAQPLSFWKDSAGFVASVPSFAFQVESDEFEGYCSSWHKSYTASFLAQQVYNGCVSKLDFCRRRHIQGEHSEICFELVPRHKD
ncbi:unnamed protein product [Ixodes hexagonus]